VVEETAIESLFRAPLEQFVELRKQLASELKAAGDAGAAKRLAKLKRPTVSVWAVNQLWWHERGAFQVLFAEARRIGAGDLSGQSEHRRALGHLRDAARRLLGDAGHAANEATLRRITTTLGSLAALGGFEPDRPGALTQDRDPPGFEALTLPLASQPTASKERSEATAEVTAAELAAAREIAEREAAAKRAAEQARRLAIERSRIEAELAEARRLLDTRRTAANVLARQLRLAEAELEASNVEVARLEQSLQALVQP
jgi:hypothetical protein